MRNDLLHQLCMIFQKYDAMNEQTKAELTILLSDYEIEKRETDIILYDPDDYNLEMLQRFLIAKRVAGLTENSLIHYKYQLEQIFGKISDCLWVNADNKRAIHTYEKNGYKLAEPTMYLMTR